MIKKSLPKTIGPKKKEIDRTTEPRKERKKKTSYMIRKSDLKTLAEIDQEIKSLKSSEEAILYFDFTNKARDNNITWKQLTSGSMSLFNPKTGKSSVFLCDAKTPNRYKMFKLKQLLGEFN